MDPIKCGPDQTETYAHMIPPPLGLRSKIGVGKDNWVCTTNNSRAEGKVGIKAYKIRSMMSLTEVFFWYSCPSAAPKEEFDHLVVKAFYRGPKNWKDEKTLAYVPVKMIIEGGMTWYKLKASIPRPETVDDYVPSVIFYRDQKARGEAYFGQAELVDEKGEHDVTSEWRIEKAKSDCNNFKF